MYAEDLCLVHPEMQSAALARLRMGIAIPRSWQVEDVFVTMLRQIVTGPDGLSRNVYHTSPLLNRLISV